jgi:cytochrome P450
MDDCLSRVDPHDLREVTRRATLTAINDVAPAGHADLMTALADVVPLMVVTELLGCHAELAERMVAGCRGMISAGPGAEQAAAEFAACLMELIQLKQERPGRDVTSWMLAHPARLDVEEIVHQLVVLVGPGTIPMASWIAYSLWLLLTDDASVGDLAQGTITVRRALEKALWEYAPMANFSVHYARVPTVVEGVEIPAGVPVMISHAAANTDPSLPAELGYSSRAHLAFSAGPHRCPAVGLATVIATTTIETVMDRLWDMQLAAPGEQPVNRHGPFHQCPVSMHVRFPPKTATALTATHSASHPGGAP